MTMSHKGFYLNASLFVWNGAIVFLEMHLDDGPISSALILVIFFQDRYLHLTLWVSVIRTGIYHYYLDQICQVFLVIGGSKNYLTSLKPGSSPKILGILTTRGEKIIITSMYPHELFYLV